MRTIGKFGSILLTGLLNAPFAGSADAGPKSCENRSNNTPAKLLECMTLDGVRAHQQALQAIADANGNTRSAGSPGYDQSVDYVVGVLTAAGYAVEIQPFDFVAWEELSDATMEQTFPVATPYVYAVDFLTMSYSGSGTAAGPVVAVDLDLGLGNSSTSGCTPDDFDGLPMIGAIALMQRGACSFQAKAENAEASGAIGAIIFNQGNAPGRFDLFGGTLSDGYSGTIPVVSASYDRGAEWAGTAGLEMALTTDTFSEVVPTANVLAELKGGDPSNVVMIGAHLDSVGVGPGINDNGSGSAAILETAVQMAKVKPRNKVRFAWWGAEEAGLVGSNHYIFDPEDGITQEEYEALTLYLNFDMVGSPNYFFGIYDGDDFDAVGSGPGPEGSAQIEATFEQYYGSIGEPFQGTDFSGRSDYGPFIAIGIPAGGLFTGAEGIKTADEVALYGGVAGEQYDPCYHLACDTFDNNSEKALDINVDAIAYATLKYAMTTESINGVKGKGNFKDRKLAMEAEMGKFEYLGSDLQN